MFENSREKSSSPAHNLRHDEIVRAMHVVAHDDTAEHRAELFRLFLASDFVVIVGEQGRMLHLADEHEHVVPIFTSADEARAFPVPGTQAVLAGPAIFQQVVRTPAAKILINPGSATWGEVLRNEIDALARGRLPLGKQEVVEHDTPMRIGAPAQLPDEQTLAALRASLAEEPSTRAGWLFQAQQGDRAPELMVAIQFTAGLEERAHRQAMRAVVEGAGHRSMAAREFAFITPDEDLTALLADGAGVELFRRP